MTVSSTSSRIVCLGNGVATAFPFAFRVNTAADLTVIYTDATGTDTTLSGNQYSVAGLGTDAGGTVTYPLSGSPIATGTKLTLQRIVSPTQPTSINNQGAMWPAIIEAALDRIVMIVQGFIDTTNRCLRAAPSDGASLNMLPAAAQRANTVLGFDSSGQPYAATQTASLVSVASWLVANFLNAGTSAANARAALGAIALTDVGAGATIAATGSYTLPNGLILKWGTSASIAAAGNATIAFTAAFPAALFGAVLAPLANSAGYVSNLGASSFRINNNGSNSATYFWVAFGN